MNLLSQRINRYFKPLQPIPEDLRQNFKHLYFDIGWYAVLAGTSLAFLSIYATRIGGTGTQIGLISAGPAVVNLLFTLPAGMMLDRFKLDKAVFWSSVVNRIFYSTWIFLPLFVPANTSIWIIVATTLLMNIPGTVLSVGFTVFFGEAVPIEWRGMVAGIRNAAYSLVTMVTTLIAGQILVHLPFHIGYAIVFAIGFLGSAMSSYHLKFVKPVKRLTQEDAPTIPQELIKPQRHLKWYVLKGVYGKAVGLLVLFHLFQFLPLPIFPLYTVNILKFTDQTISIASVLFALTQFIISINLDRLVRKRNNLQIMGAGIVLMGAYPFLLAFSHTPLAYYGLSLVGGAAAGLVGGVLPNYLLEKMGPEDKPAHMVWYNLGLNAAVLVGSLLGPALADGIGFIPALIIAAVGRSLAGIIILRKG